MPSHNKMLVTPLIGETWTNTLANVDGIVVEVLGTKVTIASLTGVRAAVEFNRSYNPWQKKLNAPVSTQVCSRLSCQERGIVSFARPMHEDREVACPRHIPRGVQSSRIVEGEQFPSVVIAGDICETCETDAMEVLGEVANHLRQTRMWFCSRCGLWWVRAVRTIAEIERSNMMNVALQAVPAGYSFKGLRHVLHPMQQMATLWIQVLAKHGTQITGPKTATIFDHLLREDD